MRYEAIIWDCDGVLMDSEVIACAEVSKIMNRMGCPITTEEYIHNHAGKNYSQIFAAINAQYGIDFSNIFPFQEKDAAQRKAFQSSLKATKGIETVLSTVKLPMAVASGSNKERLDLTLEIIDLAKYFNGHIYSSEMVKAGKPAPDIFLYAAEKLGVNPEKCLVVEDGYHGIKGAQAAKMDVVAYLGASHVGERYREHVLSTGIEKTIDDMLDLLKIIEA